MIIVPEKRAILLRLRDPTRVTTVIPQARQITYKGLPHVAVPHQIEVVQVLRNLGIDAPPPIAHYYDWPGRFKPFEHQRHVASFLTLHNRAFNLVGMGGGKTVSTLWAYDYLRSRGVVNKVLIITPLSTMERTWGDELFNHFQHLDYAVLHGSRDKRLALLNQDVDAYIINHDGIKVNGFVEAMKNRGDIDLVIVDEIAQVGRTAGTDRFKALNALVNKQVPRRAWGLTGTPIPNQPTDAWAQCRLLVPEKVPPYFNRFKDQVMRQVSQFVWVPRDNALETVQEVMQPAIRYSLEECVDLPECIYETREVPLTKEQAAAYKDMMVKLRMQAEQGEVTAVNEAVKAQKLVQIACIGYNTPVLTDSGWVPIQNVTCKHKVWDGIEWVGQKGAMCMGDKAVTPCFNVAMTNDHKVLTTRGWVTAKEVNDEQKAARASGSTGERLDREPVRLPDGFETRWINEKDRGDIKTSNLAVPLRLRERSCQSKSIPPHETPDNATELRLSSWERQAQDDPYSAVRCVVKDEVSVFAPVRQGLGELWRAWDSCMRTLGWFVSELPRRYFCWIQEGFDTWQNRQRWALLSGELPLGDSGATSVEQAHEQGFGNPAREDDTVGSRKVSWAEGGNTERKVDTLQMASGESPANPGDVVPVFDLINCGPRNRFVVLGNDMKPLIVHNCGVVYGSNGEELDLDAGPRLDVLLEVIEQASTKVIVFAPFVAVSRKIQEFLLEKGVTAELIVSDTSRSDRDKIFSAFQRNKDPKVIVASPGTMSHGLNLQAASTVVWFAPIASADTWGQANARVRRPGQKHTQLIVMLEGTPIERKYFQRLKDKEATQGVLLDMIRAERVPA